jgi:DNA repair protein RAD16
MARAKRSAPKRASPSSTTVTTNVSPIFSTKSSVKDEDGDTTPCTSGDDAITRTSLSRPITRASAHSATTKKKRAACGDDDDDVMPTAQEAEQKARPVKRRVLSRTAFVEIPIKPGSKSSKTPVKVRYVYSTYDSFDPILHSFQARVAQKGKGKAKAAESTDEDGAISDESQEFNECPSFDESEDSGSEYEASLNTSDVDQSAPRRSNVFLTEDVSDADQQAYDDSENDQEDDEFMLAAAIHASLETANVFGDAVGSSTGASRPRNHAAALRAAAAELRLTRDLAEASAVVSEADSEEEYSASVSKGRRKGKGKGKSKGKAKKVKPRDTGVPKQMTLSELVKKRKEERKAARAEEMQMRQQLGRRLTVVRALVCFASHKDASRL